VNALSRAGTTYVCRELERIDLVERDDCNSLPQLSLLQQLRSNLFILNYHIVQLSSCTDFESSRGFEVLLLEVDECGNQSFDF